MTEIAAVLLMRSHWPILNLKTPQPDVRDRTKGRFVRPLGRPAQMHPMAEPAVTWANEIPPRALYSR